MADLEDGGGSGRRRRADAAVDLVLPDLGPSLFPFAWERRRGLERGIGGRGGRRRLGEEEATAGVVGVEESGAAVMGLGKRGSLWRVRAYSWGGGGGEESVGEGSSTEGSG